MRAVTGSKSLRTTPKKSDWILGASLVMSLRTYATMKMAAMALGYGLKKYFMRTSRTLSLNPPKLFSFPIA